MAAIRDEYTRELIAQMLHVLRFTGIDPADLYTADGDRMAEAICHKLETVYRVTVSPSAVLATVAELIEA